MAATPPTPPMSFIPSEDIELSQEERITLAYARWNEASAANENPSQAKLEYQVVLFGIGSMVERLLLHAISNFKDLAKKKKKLYVTESYVFRLGAGLLV